MKWPAIYLYSVFWTFTWEFSIETQEIRCNSIDFIRQNWKWPKVGFPSEIRQKFCVHQNSNTINRSNIPQNFVLSRSLSFIRISLANFATWYHYSSGRKSFFLSQKYTWKIWSWSDNWWTQKLLEVGKVNFRYFWHIFFLQSISMFYIFNEH